MIIFVYVGNRETRGKLERRNPSLCAGALAAAAMHVDWPLRLLDDLANRFDLVAIEIGEGDRDIMIGQPRLNCFFALRLRRERLIVLAVEAKIDDGGNALRPQPPQVPGGSLRFTQS